LDSNSGLDGILDTPMGMRFRAFYTSPVDALLLGNFHNLGNPIKSNSEGMIRANKKPDCGRS